jgi:hypothetical protein
MEPFYHPRLRDREVQYAIKLRHTHDRIKSGILIMAGASTLYLKQAMNDNAYRHLLSKAEETYQEASRELQELEPPASLIRFHRHYLEGFEDYKAALHHLGTLLGNVEKQQDQQWIVAVADLMSAGTRKIKRVTLNLWLDEYITEHGEDLDHQSEEIDADIRLAEAHPYHVSSADDDAHGDHGTLKGHHHHEEGRHLS